MCEPKDKQYTPILFSTNYNQSLSKRMDRLLKNLKQSKRKILKSLQKFEEREAQGYGIEHIEIILKHIEESSERLRKFENNVEQIQNYIINEWEEEDEEKVEKEIEKLTKESIKYSDYVWEYTIKSRQIIYHIESSAHENKFNKFNLTNILDQSTGKETNTFNNLIKLNNNDNNGTNAKIEELPELN